ncbi:hypothetical protein [Mycobacterium phage WXIN]|nr:hypothetical protein [Mycobacterium phage WXIN]
MCSPELTKGMCGICFGTVTPDNAYDNEHGLWEDVHRGVCAILAGLYPDSQIEETAERLIGDIHDEPYGPHRNWMMRKYHEWVRAVATENHYDESGPE